MKKVLIAILSLFLPFIAYAQVDGLYTVELNLDGMVIDDRAYQNVDADVKSILVDIDNNSRSFLLSKDALFDAEEFIVSERLVNVPREDIVYTWDFDDGSAPLQGRQVVHRFEEEGSYRVKLVAAVGEVELVEYIIVSVYSNQVLLIADGMPPLYERDLLTAFSLDRTNVFHVQGKDSLRTTQLQMRYMVDQFVSQYLATFSEVEYIFVYGDQALASLTYLAEEHGLSFMSKKLVVLNDKSRFLQKEYMTAMLERIQPAMAILSDEHFDFSRFLKSDFSSVEILEVAVKKSDGKLFVQYYLATALLILSLAYFAKRVLQWPIRSLMQLLFLVLVWTYFGLKLGFGMYVSMGVLGYGSLLLLRSKNFWFLPGELIRFCVYVSFFVIAYLFYDYGHVYMSEAVYLLASSMMILIIENLSRKFEYTGFKNLVSYFLYELLFLFGVFVVINSVWYVKFVLSSWLYVVGLSAVISLIAFYGRTSKVFLTKK